MFNDGELVDYMRNSQVSLRYQLLLFQLVCDALASQQGIGYRAHPQKGCLV